MGGDVPSPATLGQARSACRSILSPPSSRTDAQGRNRRTNKTASLLPPQNPPSVNYALIIEGRLPPINYGSVTVCSPRRYWVIFAVSLQLHSYSYSSACADQPCKSTFKQGFSFFFFFFSGFLL